MSSRHAAVMFYHAAVMFYHAALMFLPCSFRSGHPCRMPDGPELRPTTAEELREMLAAGSATTARTASWPKAAAEKLVEHLQRSRASS